MLDSRGAALSLFALTMPAMEHPMIGQPAPAFDLPSLSGDRVSSSSLEGTFIVLHFGAGW
jgi:hypothetical protein